MKYWKINTVSQCFPGSILCINIVKVEVNFAIYARKNNLKESF